MHSDFKLEVRTGKRKDVSASALSDDSVGGPFQ